MLSRSSKRIDPRTTHLKRTEGSYKRLRCEGDDEGWKGTIFGGSLSFCKCNKNAHMRGDSMGPLFFSFSIGCTDRFVVARALERPFEFRLRRPVSVFLVSRGQCACLDRS